MKAGAEITIAGVVPPVFICVVIGTIWSSYLGLHVLSLLQFSLPLDLRDQQAAAKGNRQLIMSQILIVLLLTCYGRAFLTAPGSVPDDPQWQLGTLNIPRTRELKGTGERRHCKWCLKYKPDRCHHCRICKTCVLRMDHHCPWILNCVGFRNHKYFFLLVLYSQLNCFYIVVTLAESVFDSLQQDMPSANRFLLVLGLVLALIMGVLMTAFLLFHTWLMYRGMSTIEFCEKNVRDQSGELERRGSFALSRADSYDRGLYENICSVLGPQPLLWLLPVCPPEGDGVNWPELRDGAADPEWTAMPGRLFVY